MWVEERNIVYCLLLFLLIGFNKNYNTVFGAGRKTKFEIFASTNKCNIYKINNTPLNISVFLFY